MNGSEEYITAPSLSEVTLPQCFRWLVDSEGLIIDPLGEEEVRQHLRERPFDQLRDSAGRSLNAASILAILQRQPLIGPPLHLNGHDGRLRAVTERNPWSCKLIFLDRPIELTLESDFGQPACERLRLLVCGRSLSVCGQNGQRRAC